MSVGTGYVIGEVSGKPGGNRALFEAARTDLARRGWECTIPMDVPEAQEAMREALALGYGAVGRPAYQNVLRALIRVLLEVDRVFALPGWENSNGARFEALAALQIGTPVYLWISPDLGLRQIHPRLHVVVDGMPQTLSPSDPVATLSA